jgi:Conjugative transposon protein TcpC
LQTVVASGVELDDTWDATGVQAVRDALPVTTTVGDDNRLMVLVAAQVDGGRWLHLAVPMAGDGQRFVVTALPALVSEPTTADVELAPAEVDADLSATVRPTVETFLAAYGAGDQAALEPYLAPDLDLGGLGGSFVVDEVAVVEAGAAPTDTADTADSQTVRATVRWLDPTTGATFGASYSISLVEDDGRWFVDELTAAQG